MRRVVSSVKIKCHFLLKILLQTDVSPSSELSALFPMCYNSIACIRFNEQRLRLGSFGRFDNQSML